MSSTIGMVIALPAEAARMGWRKQDGHAFRRQVLPGGIDLVIEVSGMGIDNARSAGLRLVEQGAAALVSAGVSGGLAPDIRTGDLVIAESVLLVDAGQVSNTWSVDKEFAASAAGRLAAGRTSFRCGRIMTSMRPILSAAQKKELGERFGSLAVDMESAGVAMAAEGTGRSLFIMRSVCDTFTQSIPPWASDFLAADGSIRAPRLFFELIRRPSGLIDLFRMWRCFNAACDSLSNAWSILCDTGFFHT